MNNINAIIGIILFSEIFTFLTILGYRFKKCKEIKQKAYSEKLYRDALDYFVTICSKLLTSSGEKAPGYKYLKFWFHRDEFHLLECSPELGEDYKINILFSVRFMGDNLIDKDTSRIYSYSSFERHLTMLCKDRCVYDKLIYNLAWLKKNNPPYYLSLQKPVS